MYKRFEKKSQQKCFETGTFLKELLEKMHLTIEVVQFHLQTRDSNVIRDSQLFAKSCEHCLRLQILGSDETSLPLPLP
jgi:hypothetical protein